MFILGSGSPRRLEVLRQLGLEPDAIRPPDINEDPHKGELPRPYCNRITREKLLAVDASADDVVLVADTTVALGRRILGKPVDAREALKFHELLSGRRHKVITALAVKKGAQIWQTDVVSNVKMKRTSAQERAEYIASNDWQGKAGGYSIQSQASAMIPWIQGSYSAILGLPLAETANLLRAAGLPVSLKGSL